MLYSTKEVLHTELVQCTEDTGSGAMEPLGFRRGMNNLLNTGLDVEVMAMNPSKFLEEVNHDGEEKGERNPTFLGQVCRKPHVVFLCKGDIEALQNRWMCIPHHVVNEHQWTDKDGKRHHCDHAPLTAEEQKRMWLKKDSVAYQDLTSLVFDNWLLKIFRRWPSSNILGHWRSFTVLP
ncbi:unnamed protein product [Arctogadus glacialis]